MYKNKFFAMLLVRSPVWPANVTKAGSHLVQEGGCAFPKMKLQLIPFTRAVAGIVGINPGRKLDFSRSVFARLKSRLAGWAAFDVFYILYFFRIFLGLANGVAADHKRNCSNCSRLQTEL